MKLQIKRELINNIPPNLKTHKLNIFHTCALNNTITLLQGYFCQSHIQPVYVQPLWQGKIQFWKWFCHSWQVIS